jgi:Bax protein
MAKPELLAPPPPAKPAPPEGFGPRIAGDQAADAAIGAQGVGEAQSAADSDITVSSLVSVFRRTDYRLGSVLSGEMSVPRILVDAMPADIAGVKSPADRKRVFIQLMLPLALRVNEQILVERERLTKMNEKLGGFFGTLDPDEAEWLDGMRRRYGLETADIGALLRRVDVVPPSLALAQAAEESGWGTSRFAREGNALFGQRTFAQGKGLVPLSRGEGQNFEVMIYDRLLDSVAAYMANLNSHRAYKEFRLAREYQRKTWGLLDGYDLAGTLERYSERGEAYVGTIRSIIANNDLRTLDSAQLGDGATIVAIDTDI